MGDGVSRARFLKLMGLGAGLSLLPGSMFPAGIGQAQTVGGPAILSDGRYPIAAWWPPPPVPNTNPDPAAETARRYVELAGANFNTVIGGNGVGNERANRLALDACEANDVRLVLADNELSNAIKGVSSTQGAQAQAQEEPDGVLQALTEQDSQQDVQAQAVANRAAITQRLLEIRDGTAESPGFGGRPGLAGIFLYDEPGRTLFADLKFAREEVERIFGGDELPYVNAWPSYASPRNALQAPSYQDYLTSYNDVIAPPFLSFDHYPLLTDERITPDYFYNHAVIRRFAQRYGVPSWGFIQSMGFDGRGIGLAPRRSPDEAELFWQINVALAYGVKGIQYFTYWTPDNATGIRFGNALITRAGARTPLYAYATRANEYLEATGGQLLPLVSEAVVHFGERTLPRGTVPFRPDAFVRAMAGSPAILSRFQNPTIANERYLLVTNRSPNAGAQTRLTISDLVQSVEEFDPVTRTYGPVTIQPTQPRYLTVRTGPGRARLYRLSTA